MAEQYTCAACGNTYEEGWSDEEARAEYAEVFPGCSIDEADIVCDPCYQEMVSKPLTVIVEAMFEAMFGDNLPRQPIEQKRFDKNVKRWSALADKIGIPRELLLTRGERNG